MGASHGHGFDEAFAAEICPALGLETRAPVSVLLLRLLLGFATASCLFRSLRRQIGDLAGIDVEHDLPLAGIGVLVIVTVAASFSSIVLPVKSLTKIVFRAIAPAFRRGWRPV